MTINLYQALASLKIWTLYLNRQSVRKNTKNKNTHQYIIHSNYKYSRKQNEEIQDEVKEIKKKAKGFISLTHRVIFTMRISWEE